MPNEDKIILREENPVLLQAALVIDDGWSLSLALCPPQKSAVPSSADEGRYAAVELYRRRRSFWASLLLVPRGTVQKQIVQAAASERVWRRPFGLVVYLWFRVRLMLGERDLRPIVFRNPPVLALIWAIPERSVALLLNGEPWAFINGRKGVGYSKGLLRSGSTSRMWDQRLFEQIFSIG
jgi:hypothetical protein